MSMNLKLWLLLFLVQAQMASRGLLDGGLRRKFISKTRSLTYLRT